MKKALLILLICTATAGAGFSQEAAGAMGLEPLPSALNESMPQAQPRGIVTHEGTLPGDGTDSEKFPSSVDLSIFLPPVRNQGPIGSCSAWSTVYYAKTIQENQERMWGAETDTHQYSPLFTYNQITGGVNRGTAIVEHMILIEKQGAPTLSDFPHTENIKVLPDETVLEAASGFKAVSHRQLDVYDYKTKTWSVDLDTVRTALAEGVPVVGGFTVYENLHNYRGGIYKTPQGRIVGGHAMCIVGYDDSIRAFRIVNSWGTGWGEKGFMWMSYDIFEKLCVNGCALMVDEVDSAPEKVPAPGSLTVSRGAFSDRIELEWQTVDNSEFYVIYRSDNKDGTLKSLSRTSEAAFRDSGLLPGVNYIYAVKSGRTVNKKELLSSFSEIAEGWTAEEKTVPGIPTGVTFMFYEGNPLLVWDPVENSDGYNVYRWDTPSEEYRKIGSSGDATFLDRTFSSLPASGIIYYIVEAYNETGTGFATDALAVLKEIPEAPEEEKTEVIIAGEINDDKTASGRSAASFSGSYYRTDYFDYEYTMAKFREYYEKEMEAFRKYREQETSDFSDWQKQQEEAFKNYNSN